MEIKFSKNGLTLDEINNLIAYKSPKIKGSNLESELYGSGQVYRKYGRVHSCLPIRFIIPHGPSFFDTIPNWFHNINHSKIGFFTKRHCEDAASNGVRKENILHISSPFYLYYRMNQIQIRKTPKKGSIYFIAHSSEYSTLENTNQLVVDFILNNPPEHLKPISVCLYYIDVEKFGVDEFLKNNIPVFVLGHKENRNFCKNYFNIVSNFQFMLTNKIGSHILYAIMMDQKYYVFDEHFISESLDDNEKVLLSNCKDGLKDYYKLKGGEISWVEKKEIAERLLGVNVKISRWKIFLLFFEGVKIDWKFLKLLIRNYRIVLKNGYELKIIRLLNVNKRK